MTYKNENWHKECFTCHKCNTSLAGQKFTMREGNITCADCYGNLFAKKCAACSKPIISSGQSVLLLPLSLS